MKYRAGTCRPPGAAALSKPPGAGGHYKSWEDIDLNLRRRTSVIICCVRDILYCKRSGRGGGREVCSLF